MDSAGDIFGTTYIGGEYGAGTVYKLTPNPTGLWNESPVHIFDNNAAPGGFYPVATVIFGIDGSLYGTTSEGGGPTGKDSGTVFKLQP
jgi:uncharacterized repeat protein (TIGR03803 family)